MENAYHSVRIIIIYKTDIAPKILVIKIKYWVLMENAYYNVQIIIILKMENVFKILATAIKH